ncbi:hypothetical protein C8R42DRAFT_229939 [Lentinula raphanica]|nr:hypothetical protein C8R42DRAFT_229939 [Lentinula raphanica]
MSTNTTDLKDLHRDANPTLPTTEDPKAGSQDSSLDDSTPADSAPSPQEPDVGPNKETATEPQPTESYSETTHTVEETETEEWDDDSKPVRPGQQPRGRVKPPVSGGNPSPKPRPK